MGTPYLDERNLGILRQIRSGERILDVGCGRGCLGEEMRSRGNVVHGIELDPEAAAMAKQRLDLVVCADATVVDQLPVEVRAGQYDTLVLADVLEHMANPQRFLDQVTPLLRPSGRIVVSLPNVASWPMRLRLLAGDFTYADAGILDRTHLRFFTRKTARALIEEAGFRIVAEDVTPYFARVVLPVLKRLRPSEGLVDSPAYRFYARWVEPVEAAVARLHPPLLAFQNILVGQRP
jgi:2-polyprenyl-3-methyl-5-hydroxy-6-metoxy-1,4-benzoquinol methylase